MNCLIIDDNPKTSVVLSDQLRGLQIVARVHIAVQPYLIRSLMAVETIDVVLIRVRLWNYAVFERLEYMPLIIFLCGGKDKLTDKSGTSVPYRLREPYYPADIQLLFRRIASERLIESPSYFFVRSEGRFHRVFFEHLEMIERMQMGYVKIWTRFTFFLVSTTLNQLLRQVPEGRFIRVSDTLILPLSEARTIEGDSYTYRGREILLTFRFAAAARKEMQQAANWSSWPSN